ncbi:hypothetical protein HYZ41_02535 [archaeon]|nr:hypothetical protein [archaeon]
MPYTFVPKQNFAKAYGSDLRISRKQAVKICSVIRNKPLVRARRLLVDLKEQKRTLEGKYYTKTVAEILNLLNSCEKNAEFLGLDMEKLFVNASAHKGTLLRRRRRKSGYGSIMKSSNIEIMLVERGKESKTKISKKQLKEIKKKKEGEKE